MKLLTALDPHKAGDKLVNMSFERTVWQFHVQQVVHLSVVMPLEYDS